MILKASQRGGAKALGQHLLKNENEHVEIHEIKGFASDNLLGAMKEAQAVARGTKCKQFLFSVSLNPPEKESVSVEAFESAISRIEEKMGLSGQPRMIVFHEKEGRRHAHAVWSRIDAETMTARSLPFFKTKLREISKDLYLEHGWQMPRGLVDSREHDPRNFTLGEWQQAKRIGRDPRQLKALMQECWAVSDGRPAFENALEARGLYLAKGDRRAHVVVTYEGEVLSVARSVGKKAKAVSAKLGSPDTLRSVANTKAHIAETVAPRLGQLLDIARRAHAKEMTPLEERRMAMKHQHAAERQKLAEGQRARFNLESRHRSERLRSGVAGLWDRISGQHSRTVKQNETEAFMCFRRDRDQRQALVSEQLKERSVLQREIVAVRQRHASRITNLHKDLAQQSPQRGNLRNRFTEASRNMRSGRTPDQSRGESQPRPSRGPELGR